MGTEETLTVKRWLWSALAALLLVNGPGAWAAMQHEKAAFVDLTEDVRSVAFAPDGKTLAICTGVVIKVWDSAAKKERFSLSGGAGAVFSPQGDLLAAPGQDENNNDGLMIWDITGKDFKPEELIRGKKRIFIPDDNVRSPRFSADGKTIAAAVGSKVKFWDVATGKEGEPLQKGHKASINVIAFANDCKAVLSGDARGLLVLWDISTPATPRKLAEYATPNNQAINTLAVAGNYAALGTSGGDIVVVDTLSLRPVVALRGSAKANAPVSGVALNSGGTVLASTTAGTADLDVKLWSLPAGTPILSFLGHTNSANAVAFSPDGATLATGSDDRSVKVWDIAALEALLAPKKKPADKPAP